MVRRIIKIDEEKCNGCGLCAQACHEDAIKMVDNKAVLIKDDYCDGLGDCLPVCPTGAISFEEREAADYDEEAVRIRQIKKAKGNSVFGGCPGVMAQELQKESKPAVKKATNSEQMTETASELRQWPVQIKLAPINASYFDGSNLLIAADCTAYAYRNFHGKYMKGRITLIGCPKLDSEDYSEKLTEIIKNNDIKSITVTRMEVPCCAGIVAAVKKALQNSGKVIPWSIATISTNGEIIED